MLSQHFELLSYHFEILSQHLVRCRSLEIIKENNILARREKHLKQGK